VTAYVEINSGGGVISPTGSVLQFPKQTLFFFRDRIKSCGELATVFLSYFALKEDNCFC
jgi:hypothetical protein